MKVIKPSAPATRDAHASRGGWFSERRAIAHIYHEARGSGAERLRQRRWLGLSSLVL